MDLMKKQQADMQFEAAIRLKTAGMGAEEAAEFEANARKQFKDAEIRGQGQMFKEVFATGQIMSREAAVQAAVNQEQANATIKQARATAQGNEEAANAANREASRAAVADANNTTKLRMVALGEQGGAASKALSDSMGAQIAYTRGLEKVMIDNNLDKTNPADREKAQQIMELEAKKAQVGQNALGEQVSGVTKAAVELENTIGHVRAGLTAGLLTPLNEKIGPGLDKFANNIAAMNLNFAGTGQNTGRAIEGAARGGVERGSGQDPSAPRVANSGGIPGVALGGSEAAGAVVGGASRLVEPLVQGLSSQIRPQRTRGSMEMTGNMFENWGNGTMVELHGMEGVMRPQDIQKIVESSLSSVKKTLSGGMNVIPNQVVNGFDPNINDGGKAHRQGEREFAEKFAAEGNKRNLDKLNADFDRALGITKPVTSNTSNVPSVPANRNTSNVPSVPANRNTTPLVNGFDPNINDGGKAHRPGEREFAEKFAAEGNKRNLDKLNADFDRALGITKPAAPAPTLSGGFDISKISKEIVTSISSVSGDEASTVKVPNMSEMTNKFETSFADLGKFFTKNINFDNLKNTFDTSFKDLKTDATKNINFDNLKNTFETSFKDLKTDATKNINFDNLKNTFETTFKDFDGVATKNINFDNLKNTFETTFNDFGSDILKYADLDDLMTPFEESFSSVNDDFNSLIITASDDIADAMGGSKSSVAQAKIDAAIEEKKKASETLAFMLNNIADEDWDDETQAAWDEAIDRRDAAKEKLDKVIEESVGDLTDGFDEFSDAGSESVDKVSHDITDAIPYDEWGDLDKAMADQGPAMQDVVAGSSPTATQSRGITADSFTLGPNGMPIAKPKSTAAAAPDKKKEGLTAEEQAKEREDQAKADAAKSGTTGEKTIKPAASDSKAATLDDVVKSLNSLNMQMGQLIAVNENGHRSTVKAAKSNSANLYNK